MICQAKFVVSARVSFNFLINKWRNAVPGLFNDLGIEVFFKVKARVTRLKYGEGEPQALIFSESILIFVVFFDT